MQVCVASTFLDDYDDDDDDNDVIQLLPSTELFSMECDTLFQG